MRNIERKRHRTERQQLGSSGSDRSSTRHVVRRSLLTIILVGMSPATATPLQGELAVPEAGLGEGFSLRRSTVDTLVRLPALLFWRDSLTLSVERTSDRWRFTRTLWLWPVLVVPEAAALGGLHLLRDDSVVVDIAALLEGRVEGRQVVDVGNTWRAIVRRVTMCRRRCRAYPSDRERYRNELLAQESVAVYKLIVWDRLGREYPPVVLKTPMRAEEDPATEAGVDSVSSISLSPRLAPSTTPHTLANCHDPAAIAPFRRELAPGRSPPSPPPTRAASAIYKGLPSGPCFRFSALRNWSYSVFMDGQPRTDRGRPPRSPDQIRCRTGILVPYGSSSDPTVIPARGARRGSDGPPVRRSRGLVRFPDLIRQLRVLPWSRSSATA